jgi:hypothetical protein
MKHVRDAVALEHVGEALGAGHFLAVVSDLHGFLTFLIVIARSEATKQSPPRAHAQVKRDGFASLAMTRGGATRHLIASGLTGEPTAPVIGIAGATNMNS